MRYDRHYDVPVGKRCLSKLNALPHLFLYKAYLRRATAMIDKNGKIFAK
jgi:hypothetical protein